MRSYTYDEARRASLTYFLGDELAADVFVGKYALRDLRGALYEASPEHMHRRLAREFARIESKYPNPLSEDEIFELLSSWEVVAQGSPMSAVGNPYQFQSLSNCFVIDPPADSYGGIMKTDQEQAQIMKRRGGVGFDISTIRPRGLQTANAARTTDGIGVFMERFSNTCREVAQGGRRGALMLSISVHHPEIRTFINIKKDTKKVTGANISIRLTDEFMNAVKNGDKVHLRFPVEKCVEHSVEAWEDARQLWHEIIEAAWQSAEPGLLFWDTVIRRGPADAYVAAGYKSTSTNPCLTGDVRIAVADGRGYVPIGQLAEEGKDVPVYCHQEATGKMIVRLMRNPRLTGKNIPVFKVTIEGGHTFKATGNHKMIMRDGSRKRIDELVNGDQLMISKRVERTLVEMGSVPRSANPNHYVMLENFRGSCAEHRLIWQHHNGPVPNGHVIHHVNFNSKDNTLANLQCMEYHAHKELHAAAVRGTNNPIFKIKADPKRFAEYSAKMSQSVSGMNNPRAFVNISNEMIKDHIIAETKRLGRRVSTTEWYSYAKAHGLPMGFTGSQRQELGSLYDLSVWAAKEVGLKYPELDVRVQRTLATAIEQGYEADVVDGEVHVNRTCEWCSEHFTNPWGRREIAFCSHSCSNLYANRKEGKNEARKASLQAMHAKKAEETRKKQLDVFTQLRFSLNRDPFGKEWVEGCKKLNIPARIGTKNGFESWPALKEAASLHNHRVISVEPCGSEDVYNGTVDEEHSYCFGGWDIGNNEQLQVHSLNCGELTLSSYDSCRLLLVNLSKFVRNPFTPQAYFDFERYDYVAQRAQRLMDDLVDLELEAVDRIINKIVADPEPEDVKLLELQLWQKIRNAANNGRRTGLGITALGDALAFMNVRYGSDESVKVTEDLYKGLALAAYRSTVQMAHERGAFPVFSREVESGHPFIEQVLDADPKLRAAYNLHGRRNIALTTTAPAGSVSILTQTTSGCEPAFLLSYKRRKKINPNDQDVNVDFIDALGDRWTEYTVYHHGFKKWMEVTGETDVKKSPYFGATSNDIDWVRKIDVQAAAQKWICHSISNTTNIPNDTTIDVVKEIYMRGWETGCKGVTIYRDGSRDGVLVKDEKKEVEETQVQPTQVIETHAPKRPKELECDVHRVSIKGEQYLVLVGLLDGRPYEVFAGLSEHVEVPRKVKKAILIKNGKKDGIATYNLRIPTDIDDNILIKDVVNLFDNPVHGAFTRTISLALRHGVPVQYLVEQLRKDKHGDMTSFNTVIARVLSKGYILDGTKATLEKQCPQCDGVNLQYQQGCVTCLDCGNSKCG